MTRMRRERAWFICARLSGGEWSPISAANFPTRKQALSEYKALVRLGWHPGEIDVCRGEIVIELKPQISSLRVKVTP